MTILMEAERAGARARPRTAKSEAERARGAAGGYVLVHVEALLTGWWCYAERLMTLRQLRVWLALHEMAARRVAGGGEERKPRYELRELERLVGGVGGRHLRADTRRLEALGLAKVTRGSMSLLSGVDELKLDESAKDAARALVEKVENHARRLPLPRRVLRFLAASGTRVLFATTLGHLLRCLYARDRGLSARGRVKASWVADVFGVDVRGAERARAHLVEVGLLVGAEERTPREQAFERRWGKACVVNLEWVGPGPAKPAAAVENRDGGASGLPVVVAKNDTGLPVVRNQDPLQEEDNNQNPGAAPARAPASGASSKAGPEEARRKPFTSSAAAATTRPTLKHFVPEDLTDTSRLLALHAQAANAGLAPAGERGELEFIALAEHARCYATRNAPGLFAWLLKRGRFAFITQDDEEAARRRLKEARYGVAAPRPVGPSSRFNGYGAADATMAEPANVGALLANLLAEVGVGVDDSSTRSASR